MADEMRGFVFAVVFIIVFSTLLVSIPADFLGEEETPSTVIPIDPSLVSGFDETENWTRAAYVGAPPVYQYNLDGDSWRSTDYTTYFNLGTKILIWGIFWFGAMDYCEFIGPNGTNRGPNLALTSITADATEGSVSYSLHHLLSGDSGGNLVCYWNTTKYATATLAWASDELYLLHGIGFTTSATTNIGALLVSLLFLQLPNVPVLVNMFIAIPIWACIIYVFWYVIKEMIPFV